MGVKIVSTEEGLRRSHVGDGNMLVKTFTKLIDANDDVEITPVVALAA